MKKHIVLLLILLISQPIISYAQEQVIIVPFDPSSLSVPHPSHEGAPITLKAIIRNANCGSGYFVWWDVNRNGNYNDDYRMSVSRDPSVSEVRNISRTFLTPNVTGNTAININVKVRSRCTNLEYFATFRLDVHDFTPDPNPQNWTDYQIDVMSAMAVSETMWNAHRNMNTFSGTPTSSGIQGRANYNAGVAELITLFVKNGHLPAYPVGSINPYTLSLPTNWATENNQRWNTDPYAESVTRLINYLSSTFFEANLLSGTSQEDNTVGYDTSQNVLTGTRIPGTLDGKGVRSTLFLSDRGRTGSTGGFLESIAMSLTTLGGTPVQVGTLAGRSWESVTQQMVDYLGDAQVDSGGAIGSWDYSPRHGAFSIGSSKAESLSFVTKGLQVAEEKGSSWGVIVNNTHKYRLVKAIAQLQNTNGSSKRFGSNINPIGAAYLTGGLIGACRWLGINNFSTADTTVPFPNEATYTRAQLKNIYDSYISYSIAKYPSIEARDPNNWTDGFWQNGSYLCGNTNGVYNQNGCMNLYTLYLHSQGYQSGSPNIAMMGAHDWRKEFNISIIRAQDRVMNVNNPNTGLYNFGRVVQGYCSTNAHTCIYGPGQWSTILAGLALTPENFNHIVSCRSTTGTDTRTECDSLLWIDGITYYANNNTATFNLVNGVGTGCDSLVTLNLTIKNAVNNTTNTNVCYNDSYTYADLTLVNNIITNQSHTSILSGMAANGCDSILTENLIVLLELTSARNETVCFGDSIVVNGTTYNASNLSGTEVFTNIGAYNCDSTVAVNLTIIPEKIGTHNETVCFGDSIVVNGTTYNASNLSGTEIFTGIGAYNCDSTVAVNLTIIPQKTGTHNETVCFGDSIVVNGTNYNAGNLSGTEIFTGIGAYNCDSTVAVNLTIIPEKTGTHNETVCFGDSIVVNGTTYNASNLSGTEVFTNVGSYNCDSTVVVNLTIIPEKTGVHNETVCFGDSIVVNGTTYNASNLSGTEIFTNIGSYNCDSTVAVTLTIIPEKTGTHNETVCFGDSIVVNGTTYNASNLSGTEIFIGIGAYNCDSTVAVNLTIIPQKTGTHNETVCFGDSIVVNGTTYNASNLSGTEIFTNIGSYNCDSTVAVTLTVLPAIDVTVTTTSPSITANQTGATYRWLDCNNNNSAILGETGITYTATSNGDYAVEITVSNCVDTSACINITSIGIPENMLFNNVSIYPNPNKGLVNIDLGSLKNIELRVFYTNGQLIYEKENINSPVFQFELNVSAGLYILEISSNNETQKYRLIMK